MRDLRGPRDSLTLTALPTALPFVLVLTGHPLLASVPHAVWSPECPPSYSSFYSMTGMMCGGGRRVGAELPGAAQVTAGGGGRSGAAAEWAHSQGHVKHQPVTGTQDAAVWAGQQCPGKQWFPKWGPLGACGRDTSRFPGV